MIVVCPGFAPPEVTEGFRTNFLPLHQRATLWVPTTIAPFDGIAIARFLGQQSPPPGLIVLAFSAGVVGAIAAAQIYQHQGGKISGFLAWDGWGVPLVGDFPLARVSHDELTHWSSHLLGGGEASFYAEPAVEHLDLWRDPHLVQGWAQRSWGARSRCSLLSYCAERLAQWEAGWFQS